MASQWLEYGDESEEEHEEIWEHEWEHPQGRRGGGGAGPHGRRGDQPRSKQHIGRWIRADWIDTPDHHVLKIDLPGVKKDRVHVRIEGSRTLIISGEKQRERPDKEKGEKARYFERFGGEFARAFRLPRNAKLDEITARMEDGVLTVTVGKFKVAEQKPDVRTIDIQFAQHQAAPQGESSSAAPAGEVNVGGAQQQSAATAVA